MIKHFRELHVWQKADGLAHAVFDITDGIPRHAMDVTAQLRRAALSVPTNLAEGSATSHTRELLQFVNVSRRSARETEYLLLFSHHRKLISAKDAQRLVGGYDEVNRMLNGLTRSLGRAR